jgi:hypothetical protein
VTAGRNDLCPCGSGLRFKACHGSLAAPVRAPRVHFVVPGAQKGGTTALTTYLREHPEICMPRAMKEMHYFSNDSGHFAQAVVDHDDYHAKFHPQAGQRLWCDATPLYMFHGSAPARIREYNPAMKMIILLRNPLTRAFSHWNMEVKREREPLSFDEAVRTEGERVHADARQAHRRAYVERGRYAAQLRRIWTLFPVRQTLILKSEEFRADAAPGLAKIAEFLGIRPFPRTEPRRILTLAYDRPMSRSAFDYLREIFAADIDELERLLGWDLSDWRAGPGHGAAVD